MIEKKLFGLTGHKSTRTLFGAAALARVDQATADKALEVLLQYGVNHIDVAPRYGDAELRLAPWLVDHGDRFFLATKTGERDYQKARDEFYRSLDRLGTDRVDLIQLHNLVDEDEWKSAMGPRGALEAMIQARQEGLVDYIGVTGHGFDAPLRHLQSLEMFSFDSVLLPYNWFLYQNREYAESFDRLLNVCRERNVAVQTIKCLARRPWPGQRSRSCWYEPLEKQEHIALAVDWVLGNPDVFLNTTGDVDILPLVLKAAAEAGVRPGDDSMRKMAEGLEMEYIFDGNSALMRP